MAPLAFADLVEAAHRRLAPRKRLLVVLLLAVIGLSFLLFQTVPRREDVSALLPDGPGAAAEQLRLLQRAPLARKVTLHLVADPSLGEDEARSRLARASDLLAQGLPPALFPRVISGPGGGEAASLLPLLLEALPRLATERDLEEMERRAEPDEIRKRIRAAYVSLLSPEGMAMQGLLREDPLGFREIAAGKLRHGNVTGNLDLAGGRFQSRDGRHALLFAETPVAFTDVEGSERLLAAFEDAAGKLPPLGVRAELLSAHRYTLANARAIKRDLAVILTAASAAILLLFLLFFRGWSALWVFLLPFGGLAFAGAVAGTLLGGLNGITLGFGAVLLGISVDYGIYVTMACRARPHDRPGALRRLANPLLFGMLTTVAGFLTLLASSLPGQRELALFATAGIVFSFVAALFALPHLLPAKSAPLPENRALDALIPSGRPRPALAAAWCFVLAVLAFHAPGIRFAGDLKRLGVVPDDLRAAETAISELLGSSRGQALFWAGGATEEEARRNAETLWADLAARLPDAAPVGLSPLLPSLETQRENLRRWNAFWTPQRRARLSADVEAAAAPLGFSSDAFAPFFRRLGEEPPPVEASRWREAGLGDLLDALSFADEGGVGMTLLVADTPAARRFWSEREAAHPGVRMVSPAGLADLLAQAIRADFFTFVLLAAGAVALLTALLLRSLRLTLAALAPAGASLVALFGVCALTGVAFDLFNVVGAILLSGITVDYGIFLATRDPSETDRHTARAVALAALNTLAGVGSLALATHPALFSVGLTVAVGVAAALPTALWITPLLKGREAS